MFKYKFCSISPWPLALGVMSALLLSSCRPAAAPPPKLTPKEVTAPYLPYQPVQQQAVKALPYKPPQKNKIVIALDAGHGGEDFGTHSNGTTKYHEKYLNMSTTLIVKNFLDKFGYEVILTRSDDTFISLDERAIFANTQNPRIFVSIHYNSAPNPEAQGIEVFYYKNDPDKERVDDSRKLAQFILARTTQNTKAKSRGVKHGNYAVIRETDMPAVLIEKGFLTNPEEMGKIKTPSYLKSLALGIAQGIQDYLK